MKPIHKPAYTVFLRTGASCNLGCKTCPAGRNEKQPGAMMRPEMLEKIIKRIHDQDCVIINMAFHYYNEPFLNPWIANLLAVAHNNGITNCVMSTNLTLFKNVPSVLDLGLRNMIISLSGFTQSVYERSHAYGPGIEVVKENMRKVAALKKDRTFVRVSWHRYAYNTHEEHLMKQLSDECGFHFTPYNTGLLPLERVGQRWVDGLEDKAEEDLLTKVAEAKDLCFERKDWDCIHQQRMITIDSDGMLHNCCVENHTANIRGSIFELGLEDFNENRKKNDTTCNACKAQGLHVYAMQQYRRPFTLKNTLLKKAEWTWRELCLGGIFPSASAAWTDRAYSRPNKT